MHKPSILLLPIASLFFCSCGKDAVAENYDTAPTPGAQAPTSPILPAAHPTYDSAAYEDQSAAIPPPPVDGIATTPTAPTSPATATVPMNPPNARGERDYYVAPGDSLWKISRTFNVPIESIKQANGMTTDTVVLGKKLIIPAQ